MAEKDRTEIILFLKKEIGMLLENPEIANSIELNESIQDIGVDSIKTMNLIVIAEQEFDVVFEGQELLIDRLNTINRIADFIQAKMGERT